LSKVGTGTVKISYGSATLQHTLRRQKNGKRTRVYLAREIPDPAKRVPDSDPQPGPFQVHGAVDGRPAALGEDVENNQRHGASLAHLSFQ
jgi:hypothetical protein